MDPVDGVSNLDCDHRVGRGRLTRLCTVLFRVQVAGWHQNSMELAKLGIFNFSLLVQCLVYFAELVSAIMVPFSVQWISDSMYLFRRNIRRSSSEALHSTRQTIRPFYNPAPWSDCLVLRVLCVSYSSICKIVHHLLESGLKWIEQDRLGYSTLLSLE